MRYTTQGIFYGKDSPDSQGFISLGRKTLILRKIRDMDSGQIFLHLQVWHSDDSSTDITLPRSEVFASNCKALLDCGADLSNRRSFFEFLNSQESLLPLQNSHKSIGWEPNLENRIDLFKGFESVPKRSVYEGYLDIKPTGTFQKWKETVEAYAMPHIPLQFGIVLGISSIVAGFLQNELDGSLFVHIFGNSSKGKTTLAMLALSVAANPSPFSKKSLFADWSDTQNYLLSTLRNNYGYPVVFDELSKVTVSNISNFVYNVANGRERGRLNTDSTQKDIGGWSTTIISTGESSLLSLCNQNKGLLVRVLEIYFDRITENAKEAEALKSGILENYAHVHPIVAEYLSCRENDIIEKWHKWREKITLSIPLNSELLPRLSKRLAVLMLSAEIGTVCLGLNFNLDEIFALLVNSVIKQDERNPLDMLSSVIQYLLQDIVGKPNHYQKISRTNIEVNISNDRTAFIKSFSVSKKSKTGFRYLKEIQYIPVKLKELLSSGGFTDINAILDLLDQKGYLATENGHKSVKRSVCGVSTRMYVLHFPENFLS